MGDLLDRIEKDLRDLGQISKEERDAVAAAMRRAAALRDGADAMTADILLIARASARHLRRRASDAATDGDRRMLVGARVPRSLAMRCRAAADAEGISLYRWTMNALLAALERSAAPPG